MKLLETLIFPVVCPKPKNCDMVIVHVMVLDCVMTSACVLVSYNL